ncbi:hypothetical protein T09_14903 [Trichinella sp. T9]|nr:hypothetical protein T09_14903 [Trichinella sp. T9]
MLKLPTFIAHPMDNWKQGKENFLFLAPCSSVVKNQAELLMKHGLCLIPDRIHPDLAESLANDAKYGASVACVLSKEAAALFRKMITTKNLDACI